MDVRVGLWRKLSAEESMLLNCGVGEDSWESLGLQGDPTSPSWRKSVLNIHWKDWCWSWNSNTLATWWEELTHLKRPWYWERLKVGGEGDGRGLDGWMASSTQWTWVWVNLMMDREHWRATVHGISESRRRLRDWTELNWSPNPFILLPGGTPWLLFPAALRVTESWCIYSFYLWLINTSHTRVLIFFPAQWNSGIYWGWCNMKHKKLGSLLSTGRDLPRRTPFGFYMNEK